MSVTPADRRLLHPALDGADGVPLRAALLSDQQRLAVVLQGAALLAHLEHGGWFLIDGWEKARVTAAGGLRVDGVERGRGEVPVQVLLRRLLCRAFRSEAIAGRGAARKAARRLTDLWRPALVPVPAAAAVAEVFAAAPFLWSAPFGASRTALVAEHVADGRARTWLAGPGDVRRRFFARGRGRAALEALVAGGEALDLWEGWEAGVDPGALAARGELRRAAAVWRRLPPEKGAEVLAYARCLMALGRHAPALAVLKSRGGFEARLLRLRCQRALGEVRAALATLRAFEPDGLDAAQTVEVAEVAVRVLASRGRHEAGREWVARGLSRTRGRDRWRARLLAAEAAWDVGDWEAMDRHLDAARPALDDPDLAGRWHHVRAQRALGVGDGAGAAEHVAAALAHRRRRCLPAEAGRLWNDLAVARAAADDLAGAERAARHALRLLGPGDGPARLTLALYNLAEIRLRRGRLEGVAPVLEAAMAEARRAGNLRGLIRDLELQVRLELAQGRAAAALARCAEAIAEDPTGKLDGRRPVFELFAARAHAWLGRRGEAALCLDRSTDEAWTELEGEERPLLLAQAGLDEEAAEAAVGTPWAALVATLVAGMPPSPEAWAGLDHLEPYRSARFVFDAEQICEGAVPPPRVRRAIGDLRRAGAEKLAERLESRSLGPWRALERYLRRPGVDAEAAAELFAAAGYPEARLSWERLGDEQVVVSGRGGEAVATAAAGEGRWILRAPSLDPVAEIFLALVARDLPPPRRARRRSPSEARPETDGILGESAALRAALDRLDRLASGDLPVLILGESGTGKELFARRAHQTSRRAQGPFLAVNCAALSETLIQSELFGHARGAFTGADRERAGLFESARAGTLFLDEIGDLPLAAQGKLLRVLQEGEIRRVGESFARKVDVRVIAATHRELAEMVRAGEFRQDLFYRLKVAQVRLPPLRERGHDVALLAEHFLDRFHRPGTPRPKLTAALRARLLEHLWPGNVRELRNVLEVASTLAGDRELRVEDLDLPAVTAPAADDYHRQLDLFRRRVITDALAASGGNRAAAARRLGLSRQALSYLVRQLDLGLGGD